MRPFFTSFFLLLTVCNTSLAQYFGGPENDKGLAFCQHANGFYLTGSTRSFGAGSWDMLLVKVNENIEDVFHKEWGGIHYDLATDIITTSDNHLLVTGYSWDAPGGRTTIVLVKYDLEGNVVWTAYFGDYHNDYVYSVKESADRGYLITGINRAQGNLGATFLIKTDQDGFLEWQKFYDTPNKDIGMDVAESNGDLMLLGTTSSFIGEIANSSEYFSEDASNIMLVKTDPLGNEIWRQFYGGIGHDFAKKIIYDGTNFFYFVGSSINNTNGSFDLTLHKVDDMGNLIWRKNYGGVGYEYGNDIDINSEGDLLLTGTTSSFSGDKNPDIYVLKVDEDGNEIWSKTFGGDDSDYGNAGQFLSDGNLAILGSSKSGLGDDLDLFFVKLDGEGELIKGLNEDIIVEGTAPIIFPNPASTYIQISTQSKVPNQEIEFILYDITGKLVQRNTFSENSKTIYFNNRLAQGVYVYQLKVNEITYDGKIIIN